MPRFSLRTRISGTRFVLRLRGELDGSTACRVLDAVAQAPERIREMVVDLGGVSTVETFGLEVLSRGIPSCARGRPVRLLAAQPAAETSKHVGARRRDANPATTGLRARGGARLRNRVAAGRIVS